MYPSLPQLARPKKRVYHQTHLLFVIPVSWRDNVLTALESTELDPNVRSVDQRFLIRPPLEESCWAHFSSISKAATRHFERGNTSTEGRIEYIVELQDSDFSFRRKLIISGVFCIFISIQLRKDKRK